MTWSGRKEWSDRFIPTISAILGQVLFVVPPEVEDIRRNTDLVVFRSQSIRVACRVRRHRFIDDFGGQFTIRAAVASSAKTELAKILEGWGDYLFYGFSNPEETGLTQWRIGDLSVFRAWFAGYSVKFPCWGDPGEWIRNTDGRSAGKAFDWSDPGPAFCIAMGGNASVPDLVRRSVSVVAS